MNRTLLFAACFALVAAFSGTSHGGLTHSTTPDQLYLDEGARHPWVGFLEGADSSGETRFHQSGVLLHPNWVLTSIHGLLEVDRDRSSILSNMRFGFGSNYLTDRQQVRDVDEIFLHPEYKDLVNGYDQALLRFDEPFEGIQPATRYRGEVSVAAFGRQDGFHAGFGLTGDFGGEAVADGAKRGGVGYSIWPSNVGGRATGFFQGSRFRTDPTSIAFRELGIAIDLGDSGGFMGIEDDGELMLTAINVASLRNVPAGSQQNAGSTLDNEWIDEVIGISAVPEPSIFGLALLTSVAISFRRTRRSRSGT